ncbi:hypothetical protein RLOC_00004960 [Lonchura striata]|uniref:Uncharacterized protein n=1 Tax=Lonchura striata TaxID=40157 RepID=A0A218UNJ7_9PASE|nr:hypothetical protein RLOC_00004960 [Lonchura striata domestica]
MQGHSASCDYKRAEGITGTEGGSAAPGPGEEILCGITK